MKLHSISLGLTGGILVGLTLFGIVWHAILTDQGHEFLTIWTDMHFWYDAVPIATPLGSIISFVDGFVHGFVYFFLFAVLYNFISKIIVKYKT